MMNETSTPRISVLLPVYNGMPYLSQAVDSILGQTFPDFELIVIDDASNDGTSAYLASLSDPRLRVISFKSKRGLAPSLNFGIETAKGLYIARIDADDIALPARLETQVRYLDCHPDVGLVGMRYRLIDHEGRITDPCPVRANPLPINERLLTGNCLAHPTVLFRRLIGHAPVQYDPKAKQAEDYDLWLRLSLQTTLVELPQIGLHYRLNQDGLTSQNVSAVDRHAAHYQQAALDALDMENPETRERIVRAWLHHRHDALSAPLVRRALTHPLGPATFVNPEFWMENLIKEYVWTRDPLKLALLKQAARRHPRLAFKSAARWGTSKFLRQL